MPIAQSEQRGRLGGQHVVYAKYCPVHEFNHWECCACCVGKKAEMWRVDNYLRTYWFRHGLTFTEREA